ncbi:family 20 glycosylhydrolase [Dysgonomonas sp. HGC4]|uniref:family 20 glycosylhydrolase n=1 Tax=Dysgonomonas sp. HGC4 TaxID=1658009 RepID=UPI0006833635|nr:family 20 glycosylhydrolase [Dysgonomonas sp. HGC4]MBD8346958.1 family 20 glycosylhydrolase [Dysgonomonas sp. HGC4]
MKHIQFPFLFLFLLFCSAYAYGGIGQLLPKPQNIKKNNNYFQMDKVYLSTPVLEKEWTDFISSTGGQIVKQSEKKIEVILVDDIPTALYNKDEAYTLTVTKNKIKVESISQKGVYWAIQTLRQLQVEGKVKPTFEGCEIIDYPAFRIRGFMQDVGRTYISMEELKREIAILSQYKINVFHWHLTEDLGWRLESKIFPMLNDSINYQRMPGRYYTLEEARELVEFCKQHNVLLIPEIDMPGHSLAFRKAFRHDMQSKEGMTILKLLMDEVCETFDVPYIHIGTDEIEFTNPDFVPEMIAYIRNKEKKVISWNPGWNYRPGEIDMTQLWSYRGKAQEGIPAIDSKFHYINHFDAFADIISLYNSKILNKEYGDRDHAGSIIGMWHDRYVTSEYDLLIQNGFYPSILALAERAWLGGGYEYFDKNGTMLPKEDSPEFRSFQDFENRLLWHKANNFKGYPFAYVKQTNVKWRITDAFPNEGELAKVFPPEEVELNNTYQYQGETYNTREATGAAIYLRHVWGTFVPTFYKDPQPDHTAYAYTYVYSDKKQHVGLWINFQNYSCSEKDLPPPQGKWDYRESKIWINNNKIHPPKWLSNHTEKSNETPLTNENFEVREPISITLNKGWNKVLLKLPVGKFSTHEVRLVKWMFTCVFVTPDGNKSVDGLIYSPDKKI